MGKLHINVNLTNDERAALKALAALRKQSQEDFVATTIKEKITQYKRQLSSIDQHINIDRLDKDDKIE